MAVATLLIVDARPEALEATTSVLEAAGYAVLGCAGSQEALALLEHGPAVDLLLTEIAMPGGIDGFELARQARVARPSLPIAYFIGSAQIPPEKAGGIPGPILGKPCHAPDFLREIDDLLADALAVQAVALEMLRRHPDALDRAQEAEEIDRDKGDRFSAQAWHDIAEAIRMLQRRGGPAQA